MKIPSSGKAIISETYAGLEIIIPPQRNWVVIVFLGFWLTGWLVGELLTLGIITGLILADMQSGKYFLLLWLAGWTTGGFFALKAFIGNLTGKEIITVEPGKLTVEKKDLFFSKSTSYNLNNVKNIRTKNRTIQFDYSRQVVDIATGIDNAEVSSLLFLAFGRQTVAIATGIDDAEANYILTKLKLDFGQTHQAPEVDLGAKHLQYVEFWLTI